MVEDITVSRDQSLGTAALDKLLEPLVSENECSLFCDPESMSFLAEISPTEMEIALGCSQALRDAILSFIRGEDTTLGPFDESPEQLLRTLTSENDAAAKQQQPKELNTDLMVTESSDARQPTNPIESRQEVYSADKSQSADTIGLEKFRKTLLKLQNVSANLFTGQSSAQSPFFPLSSDVTDRGSALATASSHIKSSGEYSPILDILLKILGDVMSREESLNMAVSLADQTNLDFLSNILEHDYVLDHIVQGLVRISRDQKNVFLFSNSDVGRSLPELDVLFLFHPGKPEITTRKTVRLFYLYSVQHWLHETKLVSVSNISNQDILAMFCKILASSKSMPVIRYNAEDAICATVLNYIRDHDVHVPIAAIRSIKLNDLYLWKKGGAHALRSQGNAVWSNENARDRVIEPEHTDTNSMNELHQKRPYNIMAGGEESSKLLKPSNTPITDSEASKMMFASPAELSKPTREELLLARNNLDGFPILTEEDDFSQHSDSDTNLDRVVKWICEESDLRLVDVKIEIGRLIRVSLKQEKLLSSKHFGMLQTRYEELREKLCEEQERTESLQKNNEQLEKHLERLNQTVIDWQNKYNDLSDEINSTKDDNSTEHKDEKIFSRLDYENRITELTEKIQSLEKHSKFLKDLYNQASESAVDSAAKNTALEDKIKVLEDRLSDEKLQWKSQFGEENRKKLLLKMRFLESQLAANQQFIKENIGPA